VIEPQADVPPPSEPPERSLDRALDLVHFLRARCPWDAAQTHASLRRYLLEEAHEVVDAIDSSDDDALRDELGDLLLNVAFQIAVAEERVAFDREAVVRGLESKMRRRHPHIYGDGEAVAWDRLKAAEREQERVDDRSILGDVVAGADPLAHAHRIQARVATVGFDWPDSGGAWAKVREEVAEVSQEIAGSDPVALEDEIGDLLFAIVNFARLSGIHPTVALAKANVKFARRFGRVERLAADRGVALESAGLAALDELWNEVKREEG
jgi:MazG family protein